MYRVELKEAQTGTTLTFTRVVPNVPCGVESFNQALVRFPANLKFLMYRVELKGRSGTYWGQSAIRFLMYRVELKVQGHGLLRAELS